MSVQFSIIVCVYNCNVLDLFNTLKSCIIQKNICFEVIIADDCSKNNLYDSVSSFMKKEGFENFQYLYNEKNLGTVKNIFNACQVAKGRFIKPIGAGDMLYDESVLKDIFDFMEDKYKVTFGDIKAYRIENSIYYISKFDTPYVKSCYRKGIKKKIKRNLVTYGDQISGASLFYERATLLKYLAVILNKVIYVEDFIPRLMALDEIDIGYYRKIILLYQFGLGISTVKSKSNIDRLKNDRENFDKIIASYSDDYYVKKYLKTVEYISENIINRIVKRFLNSPHYVIYLLKSTIIRKTNFYKWKEKA